MAPREFYESLPSTQDRAIELARSGAPEGTVVVARHQTRGRGRLDRSWQSPGGGLYCSVVVRRPAEHAGLFPLTVGALLADALRTRFGVPALLKWPNDLLVRDPAGGVRKLSGILTDQVPSPALGTAAVAGIGVNVRLDRGSMPDDLAHRVASLDEFRRPPPPLEEVESIAVHAATTASAWLSNEDGARRSRERCTALLYGVGRSVTVDGRPAGTISSLGDEGELWLSRTADRVAIWAGDVRVEESR